MTTVPIHSSLLAVIIITVLIGSLPVWLVWQYVKAARAPRHDDPRDRLNWLRASYPNHHALPAPASQAPWMPAPRGNSAGRLVIYAVQAGAIAWLAWIMMGGGEPGGITPEGGGAWA